MFWIFSTFSIFKRNLDIWGEFNASSILPKLCSTCSSCRSGHANKQCASDCTPVLQVHTRCSRGIVGLHILPVSIRRLCEPVLYRVIIILSNSRVFATSDGATSCGFTSRYIPNRDSLSPFDFWRIFVEDSDRKFSLRIVAQASGVVNLFSSLM